MAFALVTQCVIRALSHDGGPHRSRIDEFHRCISFRRCETGDLEIPTCYPQCRDAIALRVMDASPLCLAANLLSFGKAGSCSISLTLPDLQRTRRAKLSVFGYTTSLSNVLRALP
jgi:hypothetical protein